MKQIHMLLMRYIMRMPIKIPRGEAKELHISYNVAIM